MLTLVVINSREKETAVRADTFVQLTSHSLLLLFSADDPLVVRGIAGQSVALPCHVDQNECGEVYFLTWTKLERDEHWSRIYIYAEQHEKPMKDLIGRAKFILNKTEAELSINELKSGDEAIYKVSINLMIDWN